MQHRTIFNSPQSSQPKPILSTLESRSAKHCSLLVGWPLQITSVWHPLLFDMVQPPEIILKCKFSFHCNWFTAISGLYHNTTIPPQWGVWLKINTKLLGHIIILGAAGSFALVLSSFWSWGGVPMMSHCLSVIDHSQSSAVLSKSKYWLHQYWYIGHSNLGVNQLLIEERSLLCLQSIVNSAAH